MHPLPYTRTDIVLPVRTIPAIHILVEDMHAGSHLDVHQSRSISNQQPKIDVVEASYYCLVGVKKKLVNFGSL